MCPTLGLAVLPVDETLDRLDERVDVFVSAVELLLQTLVTGNQGDDSLLDDSDLLRMPADLLSIFFHDRFKSRQKCALNGQLSVMTPILAESSA